MPATIRSSERGVPGSLGIASFLTHIRRWICISRRGSRRARTVARTPDRSALARVHTRTHSILALIIAGKNDDLKRGYSSGPIDIANAP